MVPLCEVYKCTPVYMYWEGLTLLDLLPHPAYTLEMPFINVDVTLGRTSCNYVLQESIIIPLFIPLFRYLDSKAISLRFG